MKATKRKDAPLERGADKVKDGAGTKQEMKYTSFKGPSAGPRRPMFRDKAPGEAD